MSPPLRYGYYWTQATSLGPGQRFCLWLQGCPRQCFRCASPDLQPLSGGQQMPPQQMANLIADTPDIQGITLSGGEPMLQAEALISMLQLLQTRRPELTVILFTGYQIDALPSPAARQLTQQVDLLIDGPYVDQLNDNQGLRGSSNQQLHFITPRLLPYREQLERGPRQREIHLLSEHEILTIGIANAQL